MDIIVLNLPKKTKPKELNILFQAYGEVLSDKLIMDTQTGESKGFGFVTMENPDEAQAAITALHGSKFGGNKIRVKIADQHK